MNAKNSKKHLFATNIGYGIEGVTLEENIETVAKVGFDGCFCSWREGDYLKNVANLAKEYGLILQSVHAPFNKVNLLWNRASKESDAVFSQLIRCIDDSADAGAPIVVMHVWIGFHDKDRPNEYGVERFASLLDHAQKRGVKIALENTEGEGYLEYLYDRLSDHKAFGFCIDTGHELCYNEGRDLISKYGGDGKLIATHINDNLGITGKNITWLDDAHLLPFDGIVDWEGVARRLVNVGYDGILTCELTVKNKPGRSTHDRYAELDLYQFASTAYERMTAFAALIDKEKGKLLI